MKLFTLSILFFLTGSLAFSQNPEAHSQKKETVTEKPQEGVQMNTAAKAVAPTEKNAKSQGYPIKVTSGVRKKKFENQNEEVKPRTLEDVD